MVILTGLAVAIIASGFEFSPQGALLLGIIGADAFLVGRWSQRRSIKSVPRFEVRWAAGILLPTGIFLSISGSYCATRGFGAAEFPMTTNFAPIVALYGWISALCAIAGALLLGVAVGRVAAPTCPGPLMTPAANRQNEDDA